MQNRSVKLQHDACNCWGVNMFTRQTVSNFESSKRSHKGQHQICLRFWCAEYYYQATTWYRQIMKSYRIHKVLPDAACLKVYKGLMSRTSLPVQLQHDAGKFWCITIFTRSCKMLPFEHDLFQKVKKVTQRSTSTSSKILMNICVKLQKDTGNSCRFIVFTRQLDHKLVWKFKKVTQRSMSHSSEMFM